MIDGAVIALFVVAFIVVFCIGIFTGVLMLSVYSLRMMGLRAERRAKKIDDEGEEWKREKEKTKTKAEEESWLRRRLDNLFGNDKDTEAK